MRYSILVVAIECHYSHITRFVSNLKQENPEVEIHLLTTNAKSDIPAEIVSNVDEIIYGNCTDGKGIWMFIKKIFSVRKSIKELARQGRYDIVNIHFPHYYLAGTMHFFRKMSNNIVISPWGSDILRVNGLRFKILLKGVLAKCDYISISTKSILGRRILKYMPEGEEKFYPQAWGSDTIDYIKNHFETTDTTKAKEFLGLSGKYVITCGYNAFPAQNHFKIIEAISEIRTKLPNNLMLLFPMSYGAGDKGGYVAELKKICQDKKLEALFCEDYMPVSDVFMLRMATDMFIHVQNTDAGSTSFLEYVLCRKKIVHGAWIQYRKLETYSPLCYHKVSDFSELGNVILETYNSEPIDFPQEAIDYILSRGWEVRRKEWNAMFEKLAFSGKEKTKS